MNEKHADRRQSVGLEHVLAAMLGLLIALFALCPGMALADEQGSTAQADDTLKVSVAFDKDSYAAGEKAHAVVTGTNASNEPLRDVILSATVPEGWRVTGNTQATVAKMAAGASQTLDVYLERDADPTPDTSSSSSAINASGTPEATGTSTTTKQSLASTADPSMSVGLLCVEGLIVVAAGVVVVRHGRRGGSTYLVLLCAVALAGSVFAVPTATVLAEGEENATPSKYDYDVTASATANVPYDGKTITLTATMTGHKRKLPATANLHFMHINESTATTRTTATTRPSDSPPSRRSRNNRNPTCCSTQAIRSTGSRLPPWPRARASHASWTRLGWMPPRPATTTGATGTRACRKLTRTIPSQS